MVSTTFSPILQVRKISQRGSKQWSSDFKPRAVWFLGPCFYKHVAVSCCAYVRGGGKVLHKEETAQAKAERPEKMCVLSKGVTRPLEEERNIRNQTECCLSPADTRLLWTAVGFRVTESPKTEA